MACDLRRHRGAFRRGRRVIPSARSSRSPSSGIWLALRASCHTGPGTQITHVPCVARSSSGTNSMWGLGFAASPAAAARGDGVPPYACPDPSLGVISHAMFSAEQVRLFRHLDGRCWGWWGGCVLVLEPPAPMIVPRPRGHPRTSVVPFVVAVVRGLLPALAAVFSLRKLVQTETTSSDRFLLFGHRGPLLSLLTLPWGWAMPFRFRWLGLADLVRCSWAGVGQILLTTSLSPRRRIAAPRRSNYTSIAVWRSSLGLHDLSAMVPGARRWPGGNH